MAERLYGCTSVEEIEIDSGSDFFKPDDGNTKIRFIAGPMIYYDAQEFDANKKPVGERRFYPYGSEQAKKDKNSKLVLSYFIYDYSSKSIKQWNVNTRNLQKTIQALNALNPDLSLMDCMLTKSKGSNGFNEYKLVSGQASEFKDMEAINKFAQDKVFDKACEWIDGKIVETLTLANINTSNDEFEEKAQQLTSKDAENVFQAGEILKEEPATTKQAREASKVEDDPFKE